jgi:hypothetical protein
MNQELVDEVRKQINSICAALGVNPNAAIVVGALAVEDDGSVTPLDLNPEDPETAEPVRHPEADDYLPENEGEDNEDLDYPCNPDEVLCTKHLYEKDAVLDEVRTDMEAAADIVDSLMNLDCSERSNKIMEVYHSIDQRRSDKK